MKITKLEITPNGGTTNTKKSTYIGTIINIKQTV